jgi:hypothetical protein
VRVSRGGIKTSQDFLRFSFFEKCSPPDNAVKPMLVGWPSMYTLYSSLERLSIELDYFFRNQLESSGSILERIDGYFI